MSPELTRAILLEPFGLTEPGPVSLTSEGWAYVLRAAEEHRILGALQRGAAIASAPAEIQEQVRVEYFTGLTRHLRFVDLLRRLAVEFKAREIRWVVVKGPVLSELVYPSVDLRSYTDLDLLVHPHDFETVIEYLESLGGVVVERNWTLMTEQGRGELAVRLPDGSFIDVHWHLIIGPELRQQISMPTPALLERANLVEMSGLVLPTLDPIDALVHLVVHAVLAGGHRWRWSLDVLFATRSAGASGVLSAVVAERLADANARALGAVMSARASRVLGVPISISCPPHAGVWPRLVRTFDAARRPEHWFGAIGSGRQVVGATRPALFTSARAMGGSVIGTVRSLAKNPGHRWRPRRLRRSVAFDKPILQDDPSPDGRRDFFAMVAEGPH